MSELRSTIDSLRAEILSDLPDPRIEEDFGELHRAVEQLEAERLRRLAEIDRRRTFECDGHLSVASWLVSRFGVAWGTAKEQVRVARALDAMPVAHRALAHGEISLSAVRTLAAAREVDADAFARAEAHLVDAARAHAPGDLNQVMAYWRQAAEREHAHDGEDAIRDRRRLHASVTFLGMVRLDGDLDPETGETVLTALRAVLDQEARSATRDDRTPAQRRADALGEVCRQWLDRSDRATVAGERPHVTVTVDAAALAGDRGGAVSEMDHVGPVSEGLARRVACDASVLRVVMSARSEPLDVGRRSPIVPPSMRRAVIVRDRTCRFPGCDRPHTWCDAHHIVHWADGGRTAASNLILLCRRHHRLVHERAGFRLEMVDGRPTFRRPDGSFLEDRAPP